MAMKVKTQGSTKFKTRIIGIILSLALIVFVIVMSIISSAEARKTVTVVKLKDDVSISANALITEDMIEPYDMYYMEYKNYGTMSGFSDDKVRSTIVTWADKDIVVGKRYAAYYLREGTLLFWDSTLSDQTRKNSYLYSMTGELLNINMNTVTDFGDMVVPGDTLNIRATYTKKYYNLPDEEAYMIAGGDGYEDGIEVTQTSMLFSEVTILDMLNSAGNSIFDIYYDYISTTKQEQAALLQDESFLQSVTPASILLEASPEEVEHYMELQSLGATYQITLLARDGSSTIVDSLSEIQEALAGIAGINK